MQEEPSYKITCNECGYSEMVPQSRLAYEEGKTCPSCYKGKMYYVPLTEEARRREVEKYRQRRTTMPEEREISPLWVIPAAIILGVGVGLGVLATLARGAPPTVYTCPHCGAEFDTEEELLAHIELEHPGLPPPALANLYGVVTDAETSAPLANVSVQLWSPDGAELLLSTTTNSGGYYSMANISPGSYLIRLEKEGYEAVVSNIALVEGNNELNVEMLLIPVGAAEFYMPAEMRKAMYPTIDPYTVCEVWVDVTNNGDAPGTQIVHIWDNVSAAENSPLDTNITVNLQPGETKTVFHRTQWINFSRKPSYIVRAQGDWANNNYSEARFP